MSLDYSPAPSTPGSRREKRRATAGGFLERAGSLLGSCDIEHRIPKILDHLVDGTLQHPFLIGMRAVQPGLTVIQHWPEPLGLTALGDQLGMCPGRGATARV